MPRFQLNWRRWWWFYLLMMLATSCASAPVQHAQDVPVDIFIVPSTLAPERLVCVERQFGDGSLMDRYDCLTIGELRGWVRNIKRADNN